MRHFLKCSTLFIALLVAALAAYVLIRILGFGPKVAASRHLESWQKVVFIGDSHIGCTFIEDRRFENRIVWESSLPQQFTLMRLRDMERTGELQKADTLVVEIGLQSIGQQNHERMQELWWRMIPISWRHADVLPISLWDRFAYVVRHYQDRIHVQEGMPTNNVSVLTRSKEERDKEFAEAVRLNFTNPQNPKLMCRDWQRSLHDALEEIAEICNRHHIRLVMLTAPVTSYYRAGIPAAVESKFQETVAHIKKLGIEYHDLRTWGEDAEFRDSFHFTYDGAKRFTEWFYDEILKRKDNVETF